MKRSEQYRRAMLCVLLSEALEPNAKLEIIATLLQDESLAKYGESKGGVSDAAV